MNVIKPGIKTTEFWLTAAALLLGALASFGVIGGGEVEEIKGLINPLVAAVVPLALYIWSRAQIKTK